MTMKNSIEEKIKIRKHFFDLRKSLSEQDVKDKSQKICDNFIQNLLPNINSSSENIFSLYFDAYNEVATDLIANHFYNNNITFSYPKILSKNSALKFVKSTIGADITYSEVYKSVREIYGNNFVEPNILIIPLISFDSNKMRLGMGGGFFDRTINLLKKQNPTLLVIALAYDLQLFHDSLPQENHDKKVDYIVSETKIFS